jgi:antitoxin (DNA-binding transcriptional repressor) of toxin-antitoxin stability system
MKEISATEAARGFSALLDAVEHNHESFVVTRAGRGIAQISPVAGGSGAHVKKLLRSHRVDRSWAHELRDLRVAASTQDRAWTD